MKIVVAYKWAPNPQDASVGADGSVDWSRAKPAVSDYDPVAIEMGRQLADTLGAELVGITVGSDADASLARKAALSRGLDRLVIVTSDASDLVDSTSTAALLAAAIRREGGVDLVLTGDASVDVGAGLVPALLAGQLGYPALGQVSTITVADGFATVEREQEGGSQVVRVALPAVLALSTGAVEPRVPGMKEILAAGKKPADPVAPGDLDVAKVVPLTVVGMSKPTLAGRKGIVIDGSDPTAAATELVAALRTAGVL